MSNFVCVLCNELLTNFAYACMMQLQYCACAYCRCITSAFAHMLTFIISESVQLNHLRLLLRPSCHSSPPRPPLDTTTPLCF
ncbi:hypothetical protein EDB19DRAFT_1675052 [Suillus lakei]|nr:hypothetical protein EDB19DRAFT_1675052 [Suillus lakei]